MVNAKKLESASAKQSVRRKNMRKKVDDVLAKIRPALEADGGNVELAEVTEDGVVKVRLTGACCGCPMASMTLTNGIEKSLKEKIPGIKKVEAI